MYLIDTFEEALEAAGYERDGPVGVAFSGGLDSTALLLLAVEALPSSQVVALHVDHGVRPESAQDAKHCEHVTSRLGVELLSTRLDPEQVSRLTQKRGLEGGLRELRYDALEALCRTRGIEFLTVAHNAEDSLEGHLLALIRGSGLVGLAGPRAHADVGSIRVVRPLLDASRTDLEAFVQGQPNPVEWVEDETNRDVRYARNRLRHEVVPVLLDLAGAKEPLLRAVSTLREDRDALETLVGELLNDAGVIPEADEVDLGSAPTLNDRAVTEAIRRYVAHHSSGLPPSRHHVTQLKSALSEPGRSRRFDLPGQGKTLSLLIERGRIRLAPDVTAPSPESALSVGGVTRSDELGVTLSAEIRDGTSDAVSSGGQSDDSIRTEFDLADLGPTATNKLLLRGARPGDRFRPFGLDGSVRLLRWLAGRGIPRSARAFVPVVECDGTILWIVGHRRCDAAPVTSQTKRRLVLEIVARKKNQERKF